VITRIPVIAIAPTDPAGSAAEDVQ